MMSDSCTITFFAPMEKNGVIEFKLEHKNIPNQKAKKMRSKISKLLNKVMQYYFVVDALISFKVKGNKEPTPNSNNNKHRKHKLNKHRS
jgi:hypothetical protein